MILISLWLACSSPESDTKKAPEVTTPTTEENVPVTLTRLPRNSPPEEIRMDLSGVEARCESDGSVTLGMEYTGVATELRATAWLDGVELLTVDLPPSSATSLFKLVQVPAALEHDCAALSWVFEATHSDRRSCRVVGPQAADLVEPPTVEEEDDGVDEERCIQP